ncbi:MAG: Flp pilus assembly complex ATPase component TadA [Lachnospiraceae bacterium]|nr:Flp pilus assembly complex ATPase component TadA [Lachnospiraceae bacterium]
MISRQRIRLGDVLVQQQVITPEQLDKALKEQKTRGTKLGETLISMGFVSEQKMVDILTEQLHIDYVELRNVKLDKEAVYLINETIAKQYNLIPIGFDKSNPNILLVAMSDPMDFIAMDDISIITNRRIQPVLSTSSQIAYEIDRYFGRQSVMEVAERYKKEFGDEEAQEDKNDRREEQAETDNSPIVVMVRSIMEQAVHQRASDIHFEPTRDGIRIRFRVDGDLIEAMKHDSTIQAAITARVKIISGMDISEKRKPQDGRTTLVVDHVEYDVRVSSIPTVYGEKLVMRFNNKESLTRDKRELGLEGTDLAKFDDMLSHRHGLILVTGPTGSGKSTTLYTALSQLNRENVNIVTVEDPVEANVDGVNQVQVNPKIDMTFASALRSILRQDPDIIMIGEIRDSETAEIAIQASITGHLVVSTLHTNSTEASVARLMNMGIEPYLIADALVGVVAQRLVRRLCTCKRQREATPEEKEELGAQPQTPLMLYEPVGCQRCSHTGYYGRIAVYEMLPSSQRIHTAIAKMRPSAEIKDIALEEGMTTLHDQAVRLVREGISSMDELRKIAYEE